ncbi:COX15/CtaA family protein [Arenibaculum pallidiluteum]|uniref:COX15/CtaA family protein n=1 Tax=Arenibaculum pallidiluteum TaxID=2812559 RepID=UPI002E2D80DD|nr:COX15/CtaA family protein [Arenibaculum pallidiluteum]
MTSLTHTPAAAAAHRAGTPRAIAVWLLVCAAMVFAMAVIGAVTRLTESGLSMVEWRPLIGILPPLSEAEWQRVFELYKQFPEYRLRNAGMTIEQFRGIFFWEWFHRLWGQLIGFVFLLPFLWFWLTRRIPKGLMPRLAGLFVLGGFQGLVGWFMVLSGLVDRPSVSHYRLAMHLSMAFLIYVLLLRVALDLLDPASGGHRAAPAGSLRRHARAASAAVAVTVVWGAFTAGLDAGLVYPTWPLMGGRLVPAEAWDLAPTWSNLFENHATVQFAHRWLAAAAALAVLALGWRAWSAQGMTARGRALGVALGLAALGQVTLGIGTLHSGVAVGIAAAHQAGALVVISLLAWFLHEIRRPQAA